MNSLQLNYALSRNSFTKDSFLGVFSSDVLPEKITAYPACFIANVDPSTKPGSHWVAFYLPSPQQVEFFDSYGYPPSTFGNDISNYIMKFLRMDFNPLTLQSHVTAVCGQYCMYYLFCKCRGWTLKQILLSFVSNHLCNDIQIYNFVSKHFNVRAHFYQ